MLQNENLWHQNPFFAVQNNINYFLGMKYGIKITKKNICIRRNTRTLYKNNRIVSEINSILLEMQEKK